MKVVTEASAAVVGTAESAYDLATNRDRFPEFFKGHGPIPAVQRVEVVGGGEPKVGSRRNVYNSDGSVLVEEVLEMTRPEKHLYRLVSGFKPPFSWLVKSAQGDWTFTRICNGTRINWRYEFELSSPPAWLIAAPVIKIFFTQAMQNCLDAMRDAMARTSA